VLRDNFLKGNGITSYGFETNLIDNGTGTDLATGRHAKARHSGTFVWADATDADFASGTNNEFAARATGGVRLVTGVDVNGAPAAGAALAPGSGSWSSLSDRNAKENFAPVDGVEILR